VLLNLDNRVEGGTCLLTTRRRPPGNTADAGIKPTTVDSETGITSIGNIIVLSRLGNQASDVERNKTSSFGGQDNWILVVHPNSPHPPSGVFRPVFMSFNTMTARDAWETTATG